MTKNVISVILLNLTIWNNASKSLKENSSIGELFAKIVTG